MDRQEIIDSNKSLRVIKNELEKLLEKGVIDDGVFDSIFASLPAEKSLLGTSAAANTRSANQTPTQTSTPTQPPANAFQNLNVKSHSPAPPSYEEARAPPGRPSRPVIYYVLALYAYHGDKPDDLHFERGDRMEVYETYGETHDWSSGRNLRTGKEGLFPSNYVRAEDEGDREKARAAAAYAPQPVHGYSQGPPAPQSPYNSNVPPMAVAEGGQPAQEQGSENKVGGYGKKIGKKLGNAAIFGAGATIGSNIVNSIF